MLRRLTHVPRRILMTVDAVGGVWRYALEIAAGLAERGCAVCFVGQGPQPSAAQRGELESLPGARLFWFDEPLDWMASGPHELASLPGRLSALAAAQGVEIVHLNLPSQAVGLRVSCPVVAVCHSCLATWWDAVRGSPLPPQWRWHADLTGAGLAAADMVVAPSRSHADAMERAYGPLPDIRVVSNGVPAPERSPPAGRRPVVLAAARWWDEGKNGGVLDRAAQHSPWPILLAGALEGPQGQSFVPRHATASGPMPHRRLATLMAEAGIVASPSLYEPFGLAAAEAATSGAPLVLADIPTYRALWGDAALYADPRSPAAFAEAFHRLAADPGLRDEFGQRARKRARRFALKTQVEAMVEIYARAGQRLQGRPQVLTG